MVDVKGKTAVITGASRGIGAGLARAFAEAGMNLGLCARSQAALPPSPAVVCGRFNVNDEPSLEAFVAKVTTTFGPIHLWINNAGILDPVGPLRDLEQSAVRKLMDVNVIGVFLGSKHYARHVRGRDGGGVLVNISSGASTSPYAGWSAYSASKAAVDLMSGCLALEEKDAGLRVHSVAPGVVDTDMQAAIRACTPDQFPAVDKFHAMKAENRFSSTQWVARHMLELAFGPDGAASPVVVRFPPESAG